MHRGTDSFEGTMAVLCRGIASRPDAELVDDLRRHTYRAGLAAMRGEAQVAFSHLQGAILALDAMKVSFAALGNPALFEPGPLHPRGILNGVDIRPEALRSYAEARLAEARSAWDSAVAEGTIPSLDDDFPGPDGEVGFIERFVAARMMSAALPGTYREAVESSPFAEPARIVSRWWADRLAQVPDPEASAPERVEAFRIALAEVMALVRPTVVKVDYHADGCLSYALDEAGIDPEAIEAWRKTTCAVDVPRGRVTASAGYGRPHAVIATLASAAAAASS